jgi:hypothetical protein
MTCQDHDDTPPRKGYNNRPHHRPSVYKFRSSLGATRLGRAPLNCVAAVLSAVYRSIHASERSRGKNGIPALDSSPRFHPAKNELRGNQANSSHGENVGQK